MRRVVGVKAAALAAVVTLGVAAGPAAAANWVWTKKQAEYYVGGNIGLATACAPIGSPYRQGGLNYYSRFSCVVQFNDGTEYGLIIKPTGKTTYKKLSVTKLRGAASGAGPYAGTGSGHWITAKTSDNSVVTLEDGSKWLISPLDRLDVTLWLVVDDVTVTDSNDALYPYLLVDTDDGSSASAKFLGY